MCFGALLAWEMRGGKWLMILFARSGSSDGIELELKVRFEHESGYVNRHSNYLMNIFPIAYRYLKDN